MRLSESRFGGAILIEVEQAGNERSYFTRTVGRSELEARGLVAEFVRSTCTYSSRIGSLQGIHYQCCPHVGPQLVRCIRGAIYAVIVDMRPNSPSFAEWEGFELTERNGRMIYVPTGFAHGFQTLADDTEVIHQLSCTPKPEAAAGLRYDDPVLAIRWPEAVSTISSQDASWPLLAERP